MEVEEIQAQQQRKLQTLGILSGSSKLSRNLPTEGGKLENGVQTMMRQPDEEKINHLRGWHHSRIIRVSRASGGKDRHSKVWTSKGLRDRRVRLSVATAIQFYDLQDRLGFDQPSKAVEWLIKAASESIAELPSLNAHFLPLRENEGSQKREQLQQLSKSAGSSTSDTSKGSGLSLSPGDAMAVPTERTTPTPKQREEKPNYINHNHANSTFTELLTSGYGGSPNQLDDGQYEKVRQAWPMECMGSNPSVPCSIGRNQLGKHEMLVYHSTPQVYGAGGVSGHDHYQVEQQFPLGSDHMILPGSGGNYNLSFAISPSPCLSAVGFNRGTLQSNSASSSSTIRAHLQNSSASSSPIDGSTNYLPFFLGAAAAATNENHSLLYGVGSRHSDYEGKGKH